MPRCPVCDHDQKAPARSVPQHRRYFAMIKAAHDNWPESHPEQLPLMEFRKWLQMKAGHHELVMWSRAQPGSVDFEWLMQVRDFAQRKSGLARIVPHRGGYAVIAAKSIRFERLSHLAACRLFGDVETVIEQETGMIMSQMMEAA